MSPRRTSPLIVEVVSLASQDEQDRLAMVIMQLDMALALAREKSLIEVEVYLEEALAEARTVRDTALN
ncbi:MULTISPECIES: hypothetical protein [unclassified Hoeflea]|uniref:hypothetical protein n=1 Tax=unclassified Hoeflea TaxID=2614931 RepID=UPI00398FB5A9